jgi:hypothetical protein
MTDLILHHCPTVPAILLPELDKAAELARNEKALATRRAYSSDFRIFESMVCPARDKRTTGLARVGGGLPGVRG